MQDVEVHVERNISEEGAKMQDMTAKKKTKDLTEGKPMKQILSFGLPLLFGMLFQQLYNMVDTIIVGQLKGVNSLAAVGATGCINFMIIGFCMGVCNGFAIPVAQTFGAKKIDDMKRYITNSVWTSVFFATVLTAVVGVLTRQILIWMNTPEMIIDESYSYIFIIFMGIPATFLYNMVSGILRSLGDSVTPLVFLIFSSVFNIILDLILVPPMGVAGAAVATVTAQAVSGIVSLVFFVYKFKYLKFTKEDWKLRMGYAWQLCSMGVPMGLQYSITAIGSVILQTAVNGLGELYVAAMAAAVKINMFLCCPFDAMGSTMATYGGQNVGAGRLDRVDEGLKDCIKLGFLYSILTLVFLLIAGRSLALLFVKPEETELIENIYIYLVGNGAAFFLLALVNIVRFMIQGLGYSGLAVLAGVCEMFARAFAGFYLVPRFGYLFVALASPLAWLCADCFLIPAYLYVMKRLRNKIPQTAETQNMENPAKLFDTAAG